jgi:glycosyltransferase involved in cell wall biosynthesis
MNISVCIPTHKRPGFVEEAIQSCLAQDLLPYEILIGDDSPDDRTAEVVAEYADRKDVKVRYFQNQPGLGQAKNVDRLFREADGDYLVLLHDDDRLIEGALGTLASCFEDRPEVVAAFGKQQVIMPGGSVKKGTTSSINEGYYRTAEYAGRQSSTLRSAIVQQFPNDGYMVRADAAKQVGYDHPEAGDACDFAFGVGLARQTNGDFYYVDTYTSQYRRSEESVARGEEEGDMAYRALKLVLEDLPDDVLQDPLVQKWVRSKAPVAVMAAAQHGHPRDGLKWFFSRHHRPRIMTLGGIRRLAHLIYSLLVRRKSDR